MQRYNDNILARSGGYVIPAAGASVTVKDYPAGTVATIYSDDGVTPKTNPVVTGSEGEFFFYAADGRYSLEISGGGYTGGNVVDITLDGLGDTDVDTLRTDLLDADGVLLVGNAADKRDLASTASGKGAALVGVEDIGGFFPGIPTSDVEAALQLLGSSHVISMTDPRFGGAGDYNGTTGTDNLGPLMEAIESMTFGTGWYISGPTIYFPPGNYYFSAAIELKRRVKLFGHDSAHASGSPTALTFAAGSSGIIVHRYNTLGNGVEATPTTAGDGSTIEGLILFGSYGTADATGGNGILLRARANIRDVGTQGFTGHGVAVVASTGGSASLEGNANNFLIDHLRSTKNGEWGLYIDGADANAGNVMYVDVSNNGTGGIFDSSFLGNTHIGHHAAGNGSATAGHNAVRGRTSLVWYAGFRYQAESTATASELVGTVPGTDETVWVTGAANGAADSLYPEWLPAQTVGTYFVSSQYRADSNSANNLFIGCYTESGYSDSYMVIPNMVIGGSIGNVVGGARLTVDTQGFKSTGQFQAPTFRFGVGDASRSAGVGLRFLDTDTGVNLWTFEKAIGRWGYKWSNAGTPGFINFYDRTATIANGYARELSLASGAIGIGPHYVGGTTQMFLRSVASAAPSTGTHLRGDQYWNTAPSAGGAPGWICTTAGTFGTLVGVTADTTAGSPTVIVNTATGLAVGNYISIAGVAGGKLISAISGTTVTVTVNCDASVVGGAVAYVTAVYKAMANLAA